jgi:hypothetical protein
MCTMARILIVIAVALGLGLLLASQALDWPIRPGFLGLGLMLFAATAARRYWLGLYLAAPGSPERSLWIGLASTAMIGGHLFGAMWLIGPDMVLHSLQAHALAVDNWTLVFGGAMAWWIARDPEPRQDERDQWISTKGTLWGYYSLVLILTVLLLALGFGIGSATRAMSQPMMAHLLIGALLLSCLVANARELHIYAVDRRLLAEMDTSAP